MSELDELPVHLSKFRSSSAMQRLAFSESFDGILHSDTGVSSHYSILVQYYSTIDPRDIDLQLLILSSIPRVNVSVQTGFTDVPEGKSVEFAQSLRSGMVLRRALRGSEPLGDEESLNLEQTLLTANWRIASGSELEGAYTMTFSQTDLLEDGFPDTVFGELQLLSLSSFVADALSFWRSQSPVVVCVSESSGVTSFPLADETLGLLDECPEFLTVDFFYQWTLTRALSTIGRDLESRIVPYNTLLITSLLPTLFFYGIIIVMVVVTLLFSFVLRGTKRFESYFLRAPLSITCFFLAIPLTLLGWL